ncbi:glycosyltransferase family 2 protein [Bacteroides clarus]|uniref:glycosyltransferase family 2 protein n=1 Tax=Bacteroides clarus TaxID=626929 RepID=UPI00248DDABA|nr:glycosyltransferase [Bacteroides clarus]
MKISVILPIYNAANSLSRMIDSILAQTFFDFELLLINDGSTDCSHIICDEYAIKDSRIHVFHKLNAGVSAARQTGLEMAKGEYIIHADADDWVEPSMLEELYNKAIEENADVVICDFYTNNGNTENYVKQQPDALDHISVLHGLFQHLHGSCWNKLVKRACYDKYGIKFTKGINHCEDLLTWIQLYQHPIKTIYLHQAFYHYVMNENSITHNFTRKTYEMRCCFYRELCKSLIIKDFESDKRKIRLGILSEGYMYKVVPNKEAWIELLKHNKRAAFCETRSLRWLCGYLCLACGLFFLSKKLLKY